VAAVRRAFSERWIDLLPSEGKRSGAYSNGAAYDVHPVHADQFQRQVQRHEHRVARARAYDAELPVEQGAAVPPGQLPDVRRGGCVHVQRGAAHRLHAEADQGRQRALSLLGNYLENIKGTVFRQTQFAEFELRLHEMAETQRAAHRRVVDKAYLEITRKYYGHDKKVCEVPDYIAHEWAFIPHFYLNFYVFQYATSFTASEALAPKVLAGDAAATKRYLTFLSAGGSKYPIDLLKDAGVDMTTSEPLQLTLKKMNAVMDEMERILARK
jgi:oligoendopeptidase F